ncbi:MAG TPA: transcription termination/antitermination NusG family protein [Pirellulaceae bacterium]|nr:transcription termination/antitermination NusG family protein [Pirellulaceae bacterium]
MPILAAEVAEYPADLFSGFQSSTEDCRWWAVYTKPRQEKSLARDLLRMELPFYLPLVKKANLIRGRQVPSLLPLFDGYLFLFGDEEDRVRALTTQRIVQVVNVGDPPRLYNDLRKIRLLIASDAPLTVERRLLPGRRVRICSGSMRGLEGTVVTRRGQTRLLVSVDFLQQGASIAMEDYCVEPIDLVPPKPPSELRPYSSPSSRL